MRLMKKMASVVLSLMMVLGMSSIVGAAGGTGTSANASNGTITIENAVAGQTYKIYRILDLESSSGSEPDDSYVYKLRGNNNKWDAFVKGAGAKYFEVNGNYVSGVENANGADLANAAKAYIAEKTVQPDKTATSGDGTTVTFDSLPLGYYFVESSLGSLCSLGTTANDVKIEEKNGQPSVEKKVQEDSKSGDASWGSSNTADIDQTVNFQTTITAQPGATGYVLHDEMDAGLTFHTIDKVETEVGETTKSLIAEQDYTVIKTGLGDGCAFHIEFKDSFCNTLTQNQKITISYTAILNEGAQVSDAKTKNANINKTWLKYGNNNETAHSRTETKTYKLPVFKFRESGSGNQGLANAVFELSKDEAGTDKISLVKKETDADGKDIYRVAKEKEAEGGKKVTKITTPASGRFEIQGLDADIYYLTETDAPAGYTKLSSPVKVQIDEDGVIKVLSSNGKGQPVDEVQIENKSGFRLPSTGDMGTKIFYLLGAVLVLGSGVVLITKKRMR